MDFKELAKTLSVQAGDRYPVAGLTEVELLELERGLGGRKLPEVYLEFMRNMGRSAGQLLIGTDVFYPQIVEYQKDVWDLVSEQDVGHLIPAGSIIFGSHQGYQVYWMPFGAVEDPPVFLYQEEDTDILSSWDSFSAFISDSLSHVSL